MKPKAEIKEMEQLLNSNDRQQMVDYLRTHKPESRDEMEIYEDLRDREYNLRKILTEETEKTKRLLKNSQRNRTTG